MTSAGQGQFCSSQGGERFLLTNCKSDNVKLALKVTCSMAKSQPYRATLHISQCSRLYCLSLICDRRSTEVAGMALLLPSQALHTSVLISPDEYLQPRKPVLPHVQPAGDASLGSAECTASCLHFEQRPQTPDHQKKYRQSVLHEPGKIVRHFGVAEDPLPEGSFGRATVARPGESVAEYIKSYPQSGLAQWALQRAEDVYARCVQCIIVAASSAAKNHSSAMAHPTNAILIRHKLLWMQF